MSLPNLNGNKKPLSSLNMPSLPDDFYEEDVEFTEVDVEDVLMDEDDYNEDVYNEIDKIDDDIQKLPKTEEYDAEDYQSYDDYNPDYEEDTKHNDKKKFIDKKNKRIIPFGGNKSRRNVKSSEMDTRKNILAQTKITRLFILLGLLIMFVVGLKNTFLPNHVFTKQQIKQIAKEGVGETDFPSQRGEAFVKDFMELYLTLDKQQPEIKQMLAYFYGDNVFSDLSPQKLNMWTGPMVKQHIIIGPTIFGVEPLTDYSSLYKVSAYVSNTDGEGVSGNHTNGRWLSFAVNVYHDAKTDGLAITPDSPSLIPTPQVAKQSEVPPRMPFGNGQVNTKIGPALNPTVNGFVEAYAKSSVTSHEAILQYISDKNDINLYSGFGGTVELNGTPDAAIKKIIYDGNDGIYRVDLTVDWVDKIATQGDNRVEYTAKYVMRVISEGEGKYTVSSFVPYTFYTH